MSRGRAVVRGLVGLGLLMGAFGLGLAVAHFRWPPYETLRGLARSASGAEPPPTPHAGFRRTTRLAPDERPTRAQDAEMERLRALGYLDGVQPAAATSGVTIHDTERSPSAVHLLSIGHQPEARLMRSDGTVLHTWSRPFLSSFPGREDALGVVPGADHWRRVKLQADGGLLAIHEGIGLIALDRESQLLWARSNGAHHDLEVLDDGALFVLTRTPEVVEWFDPDQPISNEFVDQLDADGRLVRRVSLMDALRDSDFHNLLERREHLLPGDPLHSNEIERLDGRLADRLPAFREGNLLISLLSIGVVVLDWERGVVVWAWTGTTLNNHHATILPNEHLLCFDNLGDGGSSRVLEWDVIEQRVVWSYDGDDGFLYSETCGANQRLPNGHTLITETDRGRALEVTPNGETVWEYLSPERAGGGEFVARLFEVVRLDETPTWLSR